VQRRLETVRWEAEAVGRLLGTHTTPWCASTVPTSMAVACMPRAWPSCLPSLLRSGLGYDRLLSDADVELLATTAWTRLHPAA
jgi:hypothetical protein